MTWFGFLFLYGLGFILFHCQGRVYPPSSGNEVTLLPGSTGKIVWTFDDNISDVAFRSWSFASTDGSISETVLVRIAADLNPDVRVSFPVVEVEKPSTLVLKNVDRRYDGKYKFSLNAIKETFSEVDVIIVEKPNATLNCSCPITLKEGDNFTCQCKDEGGNPPANVTWFKDGVKLTDVGTERQTLNLLNVGRADNGVYMCVAKSYCHENFTDEESCNVTVHFPPANTTITFSKNPAVINKSVNVLCKSDGFPEPSYAIFHNGTKVNSTGNLYVIYHVKWNDTGTYKCIASNPLGNDSHSDFLNVTEEEIISSSMMPSSMIPSSTITPRGTLMTSGIMPSKTISGSPTSSVPGRFPDGESEEEKLTTGAIAGITVGAVALFVLIFLIICCICKGGKKSRNEPFNGVNPNGSKVITNHYELEEDQLEGGGNTYDTAKPPDKGEGSQNNAEQKPPGDSLPPVYASVNKDNRQGNTLYASLDSEALKRPSQKKPAENQPKIAPTEYASIDFMKTAKTPNDDSVST